MRRFGLFTTLLISASALADPPRYDPQDRGGDHRRDRDRGYQDRFQRPYDRGNGGRYGRRWALLADSISPPNGGLTIDLGDAPYSQLRIQALQGTPTVRQIDIVYDDGSDQVFTPNQILDPSTGNATIDLDLGPSRPIRSISITSEAGRFYAHYEVLGSP
ncbi:MAG: hypothetical protein JWO36_6677 [Myxococcales bacterium]|nr:hypothetical protein [Myxococcales bacterium]